ncbi:MAG: hypothetical protein ACTSVB_07995 [Candidatus Heimdallarchaeaceae archaeon]
MKRDRRKRKISVALGNNLIFEIDKISGNRSKTIQELIEYALEKTTKHLRSEKR